MTYRRAVREHTSSARAARIFASLGLAGLASGCGAVDIIEPKDSYSSSLGNYVTATAPITQFSVLLGSRYASSFEADLDGAPITSWFTPTPAASTQLSAQVPSCFNGGTQLPGSIVYKHDIIARAHSTTSGTSWVNDVVEFVPMSMQFNPQAGINLRRGDTVWVAMNFTTGQPINVPVTLQPNNSTISVNNAPSGTPASGMVPNNNVGVFTITGVSPGSFIVTANAKGVQCGHVSGVVR